ncbi:MAG: low temperature requirement protein A, partial [Actinomycetota bacterium]|nr:low temperature requirement protein A [Actinomycetota bacterium]
MTDSRSDNRPRGRRVTMAEAEQPVTPLELFFDLVFVYSITQVTALMATDVSLVGLAQGLVVLGLVWWPWVGYAWLGNVIRADAGLTRPMFLLVMAAMFVMALSIPEAFKDIPGGLLAAAVVTGCYLVVRAVHWTLFWVAAADDPRLRRQLLVWWPSIAVSVALLAAGAV